jgi:hypothetical protein
MKPSGIRDCRSDARSGNEIRLTISDVSRRTAIRIRGGDFKDKIGSSVIPYFNAKIINFTF